MFHMWKIRLFWMYSSRWSSKDRGGSKWFIDWSLRFLLQHVKHDYHYMDEAFREILALNHRYLIFLRERIVKHEDQRRTIVWNFASTYSDRISFVLFSRKRRSTYCLVIITNKSMGIHPKQISSWEVLQIYSTNIKVNKTMDPWYCSMSSWSSVFFREKRSMSTDDWSWSSCCERSRKSFKIRSKSTESRRNSSLIAEKNDLRCPMHWYVFPYLSRFQCTQ